ncbi:SDR family oxidoreductase [Flavobacterium sp. RHBU_24]|uniref:SDR family oxidoreductase n=1 Tax=Flavobacterium sp. RHBU_24 TaxID=3391185 RepID=UPI003984E268
MTEKLNNYLPESVLGKSILITGATTGIGRATALMLSKLGANVMIVGLNEQHLKDTLSDIYKVAEGEVFDVIADLSTGGGIKTVFEAVDTNFKTVDILINNVALPFGNTDDGDYEDWQRVVNTNLLSYIACTDEAVKRMDGRGHIVNIGSMSADVREETGSVYVATKAGIQAFSEALRKKVNKQGIKVTLIEPGAVDTDMQPQSTEEKRELIEKGEMLMADDIAISVWYCLALPWRCDVVDLKIRPHLQII